MTGDQWYNDHWYNTMTTPAAAAVIGVVTIICITIAVITILYQRHDVQMKRIDKEFESASLQEQTINGRSADDLVKQAKAAERLAAAREKEAKALDRIAEHKELAE